MVPCYNFLCSYRSVLNAVRLKQMMDAKPLSQSALARRIGVSQQAISRLLKGEVRGSKHLHRIARELGTTPAYLTGETDDPHEGAPPVSPAPPYQAVMLQVLLPGEAALARMFEGLLRAMDREAPMDEQALLLAQRLPIGLAQLRDLLPTQASASPRKSAEVPATPAPVSR